MEKLEQLNDISLEGVTGGEVEPELIVLDAAFGIGALGGLVIMGSSIESKVLKNKSNKTTDTAKANKLKKASNVLDNAAIGGGAAAFAGGAVAFGAFTHILATY